jgi:uncharacterized protein involved in response to NO
VPGRPLLKLDATVVAGPAPRGFALWNLGFRPFYLVAALFAAASLPLWIAQYAGVLPTPYVRSAAWHGHEMLFGYTLAVVAGFLLTAVRNWTSQPTPAGLPLAALVALWVAGRVLVLTPFAVASAVVDAAFPLALAVAIGVPIVRSRNRRNVFFLGLLILLAGADLAFHLAQADAIAWPARAGLQVGLDVILFVMAVMGGRVIPMFTNNGIPGTRATRHPALEKAALGSVVALLVVDLVQAPAGLVAGVALVAAAAHAARLALWQPWRTLRTPLVWVLHLAYGWIVVALLLRGLAALGVVAEPFATHALTVGAIGGLTIGMMTRTARGHTGRLLVADRVEVACYALVALAAVVRVFGPLLMPGAYVGAVVLSGLLWSGGFGLYAVRYWPVLSRPRLDGKPG